MHAHDWDIQNRKSNNDGGHNFEERGERPDGYNVEGQKARKSLHDSETQRTPAESAQAVAREAKERGTAAVKAESGVGVVDILEDDLSDSGEASVA